MAFALLQGTALRTPQRRYGDISTKSRSLRAPSQLHPRERRFTHVLGSAGKEVNWQGEFEPGNLNAKPPQLQLARISVPASLEQTDEIYNNSAVQEGSLGPVEPLARGLLGQYWTSLPARYKIVFATSLSFVICNMDKVNISVAIIPMAQDFGWSPTVAGLVQSSFFWGYMLSQIPGGYLSSRFGGRRTLPVGVGLWSAATAAVPFLAGTIPGLFLCRAAVGLGEGVAPSAATDMVARVVSTEERSRAISFIFGGLHVGSLLGLLVAPALIEQFGWQTIFYLFGIAGIGWSLWWEKLQGELQLEDPEIVAKLTADPEAGKLEADREAVPWRAFVRARPVQALAYTHFCNNWFHYTMLAWLPTYFSDTLSLTLSQAAGVSLLPPVAAIAASAIAGPTADALIARGWPVARVRKLAQCTAFLGPAACLAFASGSTDSTLTVGLIATALGLASFSLAGLYCNHADLSPRYAPVLLGLTNTSGAVPGIVGVAVTGAILDQTGSWPLALFVPSIFFFLSGSAVFTLLGSSDRQDFSNNAPFAFEGFVGRITEPIRQLLPPAEPKKTKGLEADDGVKSALSVLKEAGKKLIKKKEL